MTAVPNVMQCEVPGQKEKECFSKGVLVRDMSFWGPLEDLSFNPLARLAHIIALSTEQQEAAPAHYYRCIEHRTAARGHTCL